MRGQLILLLAGECLAIAAAYVTCPGCLDRRRFNRTCEWTGDTAFSVDAQNSAAWQHLVHDAQLAEELATRYADAEYNRLYGRNCCGGLLENGRVRERCMAQLVGAIEHNHRVSADHVIVARAERNDFFIGITTLLFIPFYGAAATIASRLILRRSRTCCRRGLFCTDDHRAE